MLPRRSKRFVEKLPILLKLIKKSFSDHHGKCKTFAIKKRERKEYISYISRKIMSPTAAPDFFAEPAAGRLGQQYRLLGIETLREAR